MGERRRERERSMDMIWAVATSCLIHYFPIQTDVRSERRRQRERQVGISPVPAISIRKTNSRLCSVPLYKFIPTTWSHFCLKSSKSKVKYQFKDLLCCCLCLIRNCSKVSQCQISSELHYSCRRLMTLMQVVHQQEVTQLLISRLQWYSGTEVCIINYPLNHQD